MKIKLVNMQSQRPLMQAAVQVGKKTVWLTIPMPDTADPASDVRDGLEALATKVENYRETQKDWTHKRGTEQ